MPAVGVAAKITAAPAPSPVAADWRTPDPNNVLVIDTSQGRVIAELSPATAPQAVDRVRTLARQGFYDGRKFFRVIDGFMDQTGDPKEDGTGGSPLPDLPAEFTLRLGADAPFAIATKVGDLDAGLLGVMPIVSQPIAQGALTADGKVKAYVTYCSGVLGMARAESPDSANSQFYMMRGDTPNLDGKYTAFGRVIVGMDVVRLIKAGEPPPPPMDTMVKVQILADMPIASRPKVRVIDTQGPWFKAQIERVRADKVIDFSVCDLDLPAEAK